jgi:hypothetical protein
VEEKQLLTLLIHRTQHTPADFMWAHQTSRVITAILQGLEQIETKQKINKINLSRRIEQFFFNPGYAVKKIRD